MSFGVTGQSFQSSGSAVGVTGVAVGFAVGSTIGVIGETGLGLRVDVAAGNRTGAAIGVEWLSVGVITIARSAPAEQAARNMQIAKAKTDNCFTRISITMKINAK